jgi:hypothetical protein
MKTRLAIAFVVVTLLMLSSAVAGAQSVGKDPPAWYTVERGMTAGGHYRMASYTWQFDGSASGGEYQLLSSARPTLTGNGCCCTYLPCLLNNTH